jgi:hypothetical protein
MINIFYHSAPALLSSLVPPKNAKIEIYITISFLLFNMAAHRGGKQGVRRISQLKENG